MNINEKEDFVKKLKEKFGFPDEDLLYEDIYEWNIENWKELSNENKSETFKLCGLNWNIILYPNGFKTKNEFVSLFLENFNALRYYNFDDDYKYNSDNQFNINVDTKFAFYIREYDNISNYEAKETSFKFDNYNYYHGIQEFIDIKKFNEKLLKNNTKLVVGIYLCRYENNNEEEFINKIKSYINNKNEIYILHHDYREFEIKFEDLSKLNNNSEILFETFEDYNYNWNFSLKKEIINNESYISFKLLNKSNNDEVIKTNLVFFIRNNKDYSYFKTNGSYSNNLIIEDFTMDKFIKIDNLIKTYENYDSVIAGVYICIYNNNGKRLISI
ncbi:hypothetical protein H8356DRAFT_1278918 [Neocallimastix lanati (nom. inval.)]|nr:hypothetical protein H8356DRAFT_1278918 [Neocallimastix sp. JGI-2020a]